MTSKSERWFSTWEDWRNYISAYMYNGRFTKDHDKRKVVRHDGRVIAIWSGHRGQVWEARDKDRLEKEKFAEPSWG